MHPGGPGRSRPKPVLRCANPKISCRAGCFDEGPRRIIPIRSPWAPGVSRSNRRAITRRMCPRGECPASYSGGGRCGWTCRPPPSRPQRGMPHVPVGVDRLTAGGSQVDQRMRLPPDEPLFDGDVTRFSQVGHMRREIPPAQLRCVEQEDEVGLGDGAQAHQDHQPRWFMDHSIDLSQTTQSVSWPAALAHPRPPRYGWGICVRSAPAVPCR